MKEFSNTTAISKNWKRLSCVNDATLQVRAIENHSLHFSLAPISSCRDEEQGYSKEYISHRDNFIQWHSKNQSAELCNLLNGNYYSWEQ